MKKKEKELRHTTDFVYKESFSQELFWFETEWEKISAHIKRKNSEEDKDIPAKRPRDPETSRLSYCRYNQEVFVIIMTSWPVHQGLISPCSLESLQTANTSQYVWLTFMRAQLAREVILIQPNEHLNINFISVSLYHFFSDTQVSQYSMFLYDKQTPLTVIEEREREEGLHIMTSSMLKFFFLARWTQPFLNKTPAVCLLSTALTLFFKSFRNLVTYSPPASPLHFLFRSATGRKNRGVSPRRCVNVFSGSEHNVTEETPSFIFSDASYGHTVLTACESFPAVHHVEDLMLWLRIHFICLSSSYQINMSLCGRRPMRGNTFFPFVIFLLFFFFIFPFMVFILFFFLSFYFFRFVLILLWFIFIF